MAFLVSSGGGKAGNPFNSGRWSKEGPMNILSILITAVGLSMDAFAVSITNGMCTRYLRFRDALKMALSFGIFQALMPVIGYFAGITFSDKIAGIDHWVAFILLAFIGGKMIYETLKEKEVDREACQRGPLRLRMLLVLSVATSIDALAVGVSFALLNTNIWQAAGLIGLITFVICLPAAYVGKKFGTLFQRKAEVFGGVILILIGLKILIEGLLG